MTAYASVNSTVEAMRLGVFDYLPKPFKLADLRTILSRVQRALPDSRNRIRATVGAGSEGSSPEKEPE